MKTVFVVEFTHLHKHTHTRFIRDTHTQIDFEFLFDDE